MDILAHDLVINKTYDSHIYCYCCIASREGKRHRVRMVPKFSE